MERVKRVWGQIKGSWRKSITAVGIIILIAILIFVAGDYAGLGIFSWAGVRSKTLWDWLNLLIIPLALAAGAWWLERAEREAERRRADDRSQIAALESFLDKITDVLLDPDWRTSEATLAQVKGAIRVRMLTTLDRLDEKRKGIVVRFLYLADLIERDNPVVELREAALHGADLHEAELHQADLHQADLHQADLSQADLSEANLRGANLREADLREAELTGADLRWANLRSAKINDLTRIDDKWRLVWEIASQGAKGRDLSGADLSGADLSGADLHLARLSGANLSEAGLGGANLNGGDLIGGDLTEADLSGADLREANLSQANLSRANLTQAALEGANLRYANLIGANLNRARLSGANLSEADLSQADLSKIAYDDHTKWPDDFTPPPDSIKE